MQVLVDGRMMTMPEEWATNLPAEAAQPAPQAVSRFQARAVLRRHFLPDGRSMFTAVEADLAAAREAAAALPEDDPQRLAADDAWEAWQQAVSFERTSRLILQFAAQYELSDAQVDELFRQAAEVTA